MNLLAAAPATSEAPRQITPPNSLYPRLLRVLWLALLCWLAGCCSLLLTACEKVNEDQFNLSFETDPDVPSRLQGEWALLRLRPAGSMFSAEYWSGTCCRITADSLVSYTLDIRNRFDSVGQITRDTILTLRQGHALQRMPHTTATSDSLPLLMDNRYAALFRMTAGDSCVVTGTTDRGTWELVMGKIVPTDKASTALAYQKDS